MRTWLLAVALGLATLTPPAAVAQDGEATALEVREQALGGSLILGAFTSAGYLGALADLHAHGQLSGEPLLVRAAGTLGALDASVKQIDTLLESGTVSPGDVALIKRMRALYVSLRSQAEALTAYAGSGDAAQAKAFREHRSAAWKELADLMGLQPAMADKAAPGGASLGLPKGH